MGKEDLRKRKIWQDYSGANATEAEHSFFNAFNDYFKKNKPHLKIEPKPKEFKSIYIDYPLTNKVIDEIYTPDTPINNHGIQPDYVIRNIQTKKSLYVEVKRQDGWVEGKPRSAGRGNAHERSCKYFTPGLLKILRKYGNISDSKLPFWTVFQGDITRDPCRVREILTWYEGVNDHCFFWRPIHSDQIIIEHFESKLENIIK